MTGADTQVTQHGILTLLYASPLSIAQLRKIPVRRLAGYVGRVAYSMPEAMRSDLERGMARLVKRGGPRFDPGRYALAQARAQAICTVLEQPRKQRHPVDAVPDMAWPN